MCARVMCVSAVLSRYTSVQSKYTTPKKLKSLGRSLGKWRGISTSSIFLHLSDTVSNTCRRNPDEFDPLRLLFIYFAGHFTSDLCSVILLDNNEQNQINKPDNGFSIFAHSPPPPPSFAHLNVCHFIPICVLERERDIPPRCSDRERSTLLQNTSIKEKIKIGCFL